jgi:hypothetical protein
MFAEPDAIATLRTNVRTMKSVMTDKASTCGKEQISVVLRQSRKSIKSNTVHRNKDWSRES